jgi:1-aminocyclopropane-1-carboxylate deaminase
MKRDDLIHPIVSGNKSRKLFPFIEESLRLHSAKPFLSFGGAFSNHLLAMAYVANKLNIPSIAIVRGEEVSNPILHKIRSLGTELHFVSRTHYREKIDTAKMILGDLNAYSIIPEGGASKEAAVSCSKIISELNQAFDHIILACGTGTTAGGIALGVLQHQMICKVHVVHVLKNKEEIISNFESWEIPMQNVHFHTDFTFGGYAKSTVELEKIIQHWTSETEIGIDHVYNAKVCAALLALIQEGKIKSGEKVCWIHTGGYFPFLS